MTQIRHIFRKDLRRHWPEILISLVFLALLTRREFHLWRSSEFAVDSISPFFFALSDRYIPFFLVLSWIFLVLRVVHGETLVGDRQWWISKPYVWWQLLLSKLSFIFLFVLVPLFHVQLLLLRHAGFSILSNFWRLVLMQFSLPIVVILCALALASITKNLAQALLGIGVAVVVVIIGLSLDSVFDLTGGDAPPLMDWVEALLVLASFVVVPVWQYARRRTSTSRAMIAGCSGLFFVLSLVPFGSRVEQTYPRLTMKDSPAQLAIAPITEPWDNVSGLPSFASEAVLSIPVNVSDVAPGSMVHIDQMKIATDAGEAPGWTRAWVGEYRELWPESRREVLTYEVKRKEYEKIAAHALNLHIQLALSEYQEVAPRTLVLPPAIFQDADLGVCRIGVFFRQPVLECLTPFHTPAYMARFDAPNSACPSVRRYPISPPANLEVAYAWGTPTDQLLPDPGLNPIVDYQVSLSPVSPSSNPNPPPSERGQTILCAGAEIHLAHPVFKRRFRIQLELPSTRLQDLLTRSTS